jgi:hypothetical protein
MAILGPLHTSPKGMRERKFSGILFFYIETPKFPKPLWGRIPMESNRGLPMAILGPLHIPIGDVRVEISKKSEF